MQLDLYIHGLEEDEVSRRFFERNLGDLDFEEVEEAVLVHDAVKLGFSLGWLADRDVYQTLRVAQG